MEYLQRVTLTTLKQICQETGQKCDFVSLYHPDRHPSTGVRHWVLSVSSLDRWKVSGDGFLWMWSQAKPSSCCRGTEANSAVSSSRCSQLHPGRDLCLPPSLLSSCTHHFLPSSSSPLLALTFLLFFYRVYAAWFLPWVAAPTQVGVIVV